MLLDYGYTKERLHPKIQELYKLYNENLNKKAQTLQRELYAQRRHTIMAQANPEKSEKIAMELLFLEISQMKEDLPVVLIKAMWDDMFGPQLKFEGNRHKLHERR